MSLRTFPSKRTPEDKGALRFGAKPIICTPEEAERVQAYLKRVYAENGDKLTGAAFSRWVTALTDDEFNGYLIFTGWER